jgi:hypothetical protein
MSKYIIEVDDNAVPNASNCYHIVGTNSVLVSTDGLDGLKKYEETDDTVKIGDQYFLIDSDGYINCTTYENDNFDINRMKIGNFFRTKGQAEFVVERLKVLAEMRVFAEPFNTKWDGITPHYYILRDYDDGCIKVDDHFIMRSGEFYFESEERALECIRAVGEDRIKKYYIGVE